MAVIVILGAACAGYSKTSLLFSCCLQYLVALGAVLGIVTGVLVSD